MHPVINFSHVTKEYPLYHHIGSGIKDLIFHPKRAFQLLKGRKYLAIEDVSFTVGKGEAVALIGRNGAGKSTSLGLVAGVIKPTKGTVTTPMPFTFDSMVPITRIKIGRIRQCWRIPISAEINTIGHRTPRKIKA
ncbi:ATP-binding cassette domain-containing protein, partial [Klebsiella pneumoniae]|uniref:ATP-binding cassette domain-containing protein n=1 Tax=Klebsiella pneumoniae TaxID=573 RepID=UPI0023F8270C